MFLSTYSYIYLSAYLPQCVLIYLSIYLSPIYLKKHLSAHRERICSYYLHGASEQFLSYHVRERPHQFISYYPCEPPPPPLQEEPWSNPEVLRGLSTGAHLPHKIASQPLAFYSSSPSILMLLRLAHPHALHEPK